MKCLTVMLMLVLGLAGGLQAVMVLNQDFEGFTLGSVGTAGQGSTGNVGGKWFASSATTDPSIVQDPSDPNNNQCVRITGGQAMLVGYSLVAPIAAGTPFIMSFSVFPADLNPIEVGSFYVYLDKLESLDPTHAGVAMHNYTEGGMLLVWDAKMGNFRLITATAGLLTDYRETWIDIKIHVTTWDAGDGYGRWDLWVNANQGDGWVQADWNNPFDSSRLHAGVNAVLFRPRQPNVGILDYFDNICITTEPRDCQEALMFAGGPKASDYDGDCVVDFPDLGAWAPAWLEQLSNAPIDWAYKWDCDELPADSDLWEVIEDVGAYGAVATQSVSGGIYSASTSGGAYLFHWTVEGVYDANYPVMVELRARMQTALQPLTATLCFWDEAYAFDDLLFRPERYYEEADGWSTYRAVTFVDGDSQLEKMRLYVQHADGTWWFAAEQATPILNEQEVLVRDLFYFGDAGGSIEGAWQEDYLYWTQDEAAIESFLADVALQPYDLTSDGLINLEDFAIFSSDWLVDIAP